MGDIGDVQPFRNVAVLEYMHYPKKYRKLGDFRMFHEGAEEFPLPVLFIGGNHEPWNFLDENRDGGLLAPNIEFLGRVGMRNINGTRIVGLSGVNSPKRLNVPRIDWPYPISSRKHATYYNRVDLDKALGFGGTDILLIHEWPSIMNRVRTKDWPSNWDMVGSEHLTKLVELLSPKYVFCGHMHMPACYREGRTEIVCLSDFHRDPENGYIVLDTSTGTWKWPGKIKDER